MKKLNVAILLLLMLILAACGSSQTTTPEPSNNNDNETPQEAEQPAPSDAPSIELTIASVWPGPHGQHVQVVEPLIEEIAKATEGRITATLFPAGALGAPTETYDMAVTGISDMSYGLHNFTPGVFNIINVNTLPFVGKNAVHGTHISNALFEKFPEFEEDHAGVKVGYVWKGDGEHVFTVNKPIRKPEDLKGLRISLTPTPTGIAFLESFGAIPVTMPMNEVYEALQRGMIDGALANGSTIANFQLGDVVNYITRLYIGFPTFFCVINEDTWNKIGPEDQAILQGLFNEYGLKHAEAYDGLAEKGWEIALEKGVDIWDIPQDERHLWEDPLAFVAENWIEEMEAKGLPGREVYEEVLKLKESIQ